MARTLWHDRSVLSEKELNEVASLFWLHPNQDLKQMQIQDWMVKEELLGSPQHKMKFIGSGDFHFFETIGFTMQSATGEATHYDKAICAIVGRAYDSVHTRTE